MEKNKEKQNIPHGWQEQALAEICDIFNGSTPKRSISAYWNDGVIPWFTVDDIRSGGRIINKTNQKITEKGLKESSVKLLPAETVLLCCTASIGEVAFTTIPLTTNQQFNGLVSKDKSKLLPYYLFYSTQKLGENIKDKSGKTTISFLSVGTLSKVKILVPPLKEQQKIAEILNIVDEDIEKTKTTIKATEKLKRGLMQELFTRGIGHTKFQQTELGEIPESWKVCELGTVSKVERGKFSHRPRNDPRFFCGDIPFIQTGDVVNSGGRVKKYSQSLNQKGLEVSKFFPAGTIVLTIAANIGDTAILEFDSCFPDSLVGITVNPGMNNIFLEYFLSTRKKYLNGIATQSAQKNINLQKLNPMFVIVPDISEQKQMAEILLSVDVKITINKKLLAKQTELKKGLMQDLLSGKKRVNT